MFFEKFNSNLCHFFVHKRHLVSGPDFSSVVVTEELDGEEGALHSGELLLLPDVPSEEPGQGNSSLHKLGKTVRRRVGKLLPRLGAKTTKKYKEKPTSSAC